MGEWQIYIYIYINFYICTHSHISTCTYVHTCSCMAGTYRAEVFGLAAATSKHRTVACKPPKTSASKLCAAQCPQWAPDMGFIRRPNQRKRKGQSPYQYCFVVYLRYPTLSPYWYMGPYVGNYFGPQSTSGPQYSARAPRGYYQCFWLTYRAWILSIKRR